MAVAESIARLIIVSYSIFVISYFLCVITLFFLYKLIVFAGASQ